MGHANYRDLQMLPKLIEGVTFSDTKDKPKFCELCALGKHHKIYSKQSAMGRAEFPEEQLHCDLFDSGDFLARVGNIKYGALIVDNVTCLKMTVILKTKNVIGKEIIDTIKRVKTHTKRPVKFF